MCAARSARSTGSAEIARAVGYSVDVNSLLERLVSTPGGREALLDTLARSSRRTSGTAVAGKPPGRKHLWVVVKVEGGIPVMADAYSNKRSAVRREQFLRKHMRAEREDVLTFRLPNPWLQTETGGGKAAGRTRRE